MASEDSQREPPRSVTIIVRVTHSQGRITAECQSTLHDFPYDDLAIAGFHAVNAISNSIAEVIS